MKLYFRSDFTTLCLYYCIYIIILESLVQWAPNTTPYNNMQPWYLMLCAKSLLFPVAWKISDRSISLQIMIFVVSFLHLFIVLNFAWQIFAKQLRKKGYHIWAVITLYKHDTWKFLNQRKYPTLLLTSTKLR